MTSKTHQEASQKQHPEKGAKKDRFQTTLGGLMTPFGIHFGDILRHGWHVFLIQFLMM